MEKKLIIIFSIVLILCASVVFLLAEDSGNASPFSIVVSTEYGQEKLSCWSDETGSLFVFLPSYAELADCRFSLKSDCSVSINGVTVEDNMSCSFLDEAQVYTLSYNILLKRHQTTVAFVKTDGLPTVFIDTTSGTMEWIHHSKGNSDSGTFRIYDASGNPDSQGKFVKLEGRGNGTWLNYDKKPYKLVLEESLDLLGMGTAENWILLADAGDHSHLRNKIVFDFASKIGLPFSPESQWVDLYLNGEYAGLYLLCERNEIHPQRIAISDSNSFLVSLEYESRLRAQNYPYVSTTAGQALRIHSSTWANSKMQELWQCIENAVLSTDGTDPISGKYFEELIDMDSWVKKYLIEEVFGNLDGCYISQFFYFDGANPSGKVYAGPVWDYDASMGNEILWQLSSPLRWFGNRLVVRDGQTIPWFYSLCKNDSFMDSVKKQYQELFLPNLQHLLDHDLECYTQQIASSWEMNQLRWQLNSKPLSYQAEQIRHYMTERMQFLDSAWMEGTQYITVIADASLGTAWGYYSLLPGEKLSDLPTFQSDQYHTFSGWFEVGTDEPFDISAPVCEDTSIYARWEDTNYESVKNHIKILPFGVILLLFCAIIVTDLYRTKRNGVTG